MTFLFIGQSPVKFKFGYGPRKAFGDQYRLARRTHFFLPIV